MNSKKIGILTGGGDCPGLNAAIRATTKTAINAGYDVIGIMDGWKGFFDDNYTVLDRVKTSGIIDRGGTILGTSRLSPLTEENGVQRVRDAVQKLGLQAVVVLGGNGTLSVASIMFSKGIPVIGIPKTIDNDVEGTDYSIGFQTAVQIATDALDRLRSTAESHHRVMLLEVMGRSAGWIATYSGIANGADAILIPELPLNEVKVKMLCRMLGTRNERGAKFSVIVVAEGTVFEGKILVRGKLEQAVGGRLEGLGGIAKVIGDVIQHETGLETRVSSLDYIQRGGTPVAYDRSLATAFGVKATELIEKGKLGVMTALRNNRVTGIPLTEVQDKIKTVSLSAFRMAEKFFWLGGNPYERKTGRNEKEDNA